MAGFTIVVVAGILLGIWWTVHTTRRKRALRLLRRRVEAAAQFHLPDALLDILDTPMGDDVTVPAISPISFGLPRGSDLAEIAAAIDLLQDTAIDLAVEQAVLRRNIADSYMSIGRRLQNLLGRQLDFLTELEHSETDPETLANLFRLDHLATRMRRNAESLLVLSGSEPPRRWVAPVRVTDVIRASLGEVEDYQRVIVRAVEPATILGPAAADLAHLLAELVENALIFSPPDQTVEIRGRSQTTGYTLAVIDSGPGMPPEELARANRRLAGAESFTVAPSKYLGHYVAGFLAARHNVTVTLHNSPGQGITATVHVPPTILGVEEVEEHVEEQDDHLTRAVDQLLAKTGELSRHLDRFAASHLVVPGHVLLDVSDLVRRVRALQCDLEDRSFREFTAARSGQRSYEPQELAQELLAAGHGLRGSTTKRIDDDRQQFYSGETADMTRALDGVIAFLDSELLQEEYGSGSAYGEGRRGAEARARIPDPPYVPAAGEDVDVDLYLDTDDEIVLPRMVAGIDLLARALGYSQPVERHVERGSLWRRARAKPGERLSKPQLAERLRKIEHALEIRGLELAQAQVDGQEANAVSVLLAGLASVPSACVRVGSIFIAKFEGTDGPVVIVRTLSTVEMDVIEKFPEIQRHPAKAFEALDAATDYHPPFGIEPTENPPDDRSESA